MYEKSKLVSVCMIAKNCADTIPMTLLWAIDNFEEIIVVVSNHNDDRTLDEVSYYANKYPGIRVLVHEFDNFSSQKNRAFDMATKPWILSVDSDEIYEKNIPWDRIVTKMDSIGKTIGSFYLYNLQKDYFHYRVPMELKARLMKREIARMDGKSVDEGIDMSSGKVIQFPYAHIHFGHVRTEKALLLKGKDRIKFKDEDKCDGPGMEIHGERWFIERNKEWNNKIEKCPGEVILSINDIISRVRNA